jgi:hypothetical protein
MQGFKQKFRSLSLEIKVFSVSVTEKKPIEDMHRTHLTDVSP